MIAGRPLALWNGLVLALATATGTTLAYLNGAVTVEIEIGAVVAVTFAVLGLLANQANNGSLLGRRK
jgi:hypothetical protein